MRCYIRQRYKNQHFFGAGTRCHQWFSGGSSIFGKGIQSSVTVLLVAALGNPECLVEIEATVFVP